ncbi:hypothetical protein ACP6L2_00960 [Sphingobacterium lactis]|uniref:hypothetical protein n=1 Tax=Sphingobacterium lactis TaxID=797291 RepID=UPI003F82229A
MNKIKDFTIHPIGMISIAFLDNDIQTFHDACSFIQNLPYKRNSDKENLTLIFTEKCGTCSSKHAVLKQLCIEQNMEDIELMIGVFKMNAINTPPILKTLEHYKLKYIPEAHTYLKFQNEYFDFTKLGSSSEGFLDYLLYEEEILPNQINEYKIELHQVFLKKWLKDKPDVNLTFDEIWRIREQCILDLSN